MLPLKVYRFYQVLVDPSKSGFIAIDIIITTLHNLGVYNHIKKAHGRASLLNVIETTKLLKPARNLKFLHFPQQYLKL